MKLLLQENSISQKTQTSLLSQTLLPHIQFEKNATRVAKDTRNQWNCTLLNLRKKAPLLEFCFCFLFDIKFRSNIQHPVFHLQQNEKGVGSTLPSCNRQPLFSRIQFPRFCSSSSSILSPVFHFDIELLYCGPILRDPCLGWKRKCLHLMI